MAVDSNKPLSIALEEIAAEKVVAVEPSEDDAVDPLSFIDMGDDAASESGGPLLSLVPDDAGDEVGSEGDEPA